MTEFYRLSALELLAGYRRAEFSPVEVTAEILERIARLNPALVAYVTVTPELALEAARASEARWRRGNALPLDGVPISIKDLTATKGVRTTLGSLLYADWVPDYDSPFVERVKAAGAVMLGKTNTPERGWKGESSNRVVGSSQNPWKRGKTPGGSSGGGAAAVAMGLGPLAQGSDGAGSIRIPAGFSGIFGHKPSYALIPQYPPSAVGDVSHFGPMTRTVADSALLMTHTAGFDARDRHSWSSGIDYLAELDGDLPRLKIAWSSDLGFAAVDPEVATIAERAASTFEELGHSIGAAHPNADDPWPAADILWSTGMAGALYENFEEVRHLLDPGRATIVDDAFNRPAAAVGYANFKRNAYFDTVREFMEDYDLLLTPTLPCPAFDAGLDFPPEIAGKPMSYLGWTAFTYPFNLTGQPAATVPAGFTAEGLPVGLQIVGRIHDDVTVLRAAKAFEAARPWAHIWPDDRPFLAD
ncbi:MAG: amidase [Thermomicrobiales bacterium]|nr:amidase [Thermomicrobiales bacterium]